MFLRISVALVSLSAGLAAQAIVEYSLGTATALGGATAARRLGEVTIDKLQKHDQSRVKPEATKFPKIYNPAPDAGPTPLAASGAKPAQSAARAVTDAASATIVPTAAASTPAPAVTYEDPAGIQEGMDYAEVVRRFGPPSIKLSATAGGETLCYSRPDASLDVQVRDGKVSAVRRSGPPAGTVSLR